jgi:hypothetical protein
MTCVLIINFLKFGLLCATVLTFITEILERELMSHVKRTTLPRLTPVPRSMRGLNNSHLSELSAERISFGCYYILPDASLL